MVLINNSECSIPQSNVSSLAYKLLSQNNRRCLPNFNAGKIYMFRNMVHRKPTEYDHKGTTVRLTERQKVVRSVNK